jgi:hypothetical protein
MQNVRITLVTLLCGLAASGFVWLTWELFASLGGHLRDKLTERKQRKIESNARAAAEAASAKEQ